MRRGVHESRSTPVACGDGPVPGSHAWLEAGRRGSDTMECNESKERVVARSTHHSRTRVGQPSSPAQTKPRTTRERCKIFAPGLQSGLGPTCLQSALKERAAWHVRVRRGACLRTRFARSFGKANHSRGLCFIWNLPVQRVESHVVCAW